MRAAHPSRSLDLEPTPTGRLASALVLSAAVASCPLSAAALEMACIVAVGAALATKAGPRLLRVLPAALAVVALGLLPLALTVSVEQAALALVRGLASVVVVISIAGTLTLAALPGALRGLGVPGAVAAVLTSALRHTVVLREEAARLLLARRLRGAASFRGSGALLGTLLSRALSRAERVELSMELRGYSPERALAPTRPGFRDLPALALSIAAGLAVHVVGRLHA